MNLDLPAHAYASNVKHRRILLVEDDPHWQMIISRTLKSLDRNATLRCVRNAKHAQQTLYNNSNYDLIVADQFLDGDTTGLDLWRECQSEDHQIPFIMISGLKQNDFFDLIQGESERPLFLEKPFEIEKLKSTLGWQLENAHGRASSRLASFHSAVPLVSQRLKSGGMLASAIAALLIPALMQNSAEQNIFIPTQTLTLTPNPNVPTLIHKEEFKDVQKDLHSTPHEFITAEFKSRVHRIIARAGRIKDLSANILANPSVPPAPQRVAKRER